MEKVIVRILKHTDWISFDLLLQFKHTDGPSV